MAIPFFMNDYSDYLLLIAAILITVICLITVITVAQSFEQEITVIIINKFTPAMLNRCRPRGTT